MNGVRIGIIGGSGLYAMDGIADLEPVQVETPFGPPSDALMVGRLAGSEVVFLARHGRGHRFNPTQVPYRANLYAMKKLGVGWIISVSAVGSLREEIVPGHVVVVDQFIDRTRQRATTFFDGGIVAHVPFGDPVCGVLRGMLLDATRAAGGTVHDGGTYVCMEGPAFSTKAESNLYRSWGASVVGMTNLPEAKLAREAEISYATLAFATDYDCWRAGHDHVTVEQIIHVLRTNARLAQEIVREAVPRIAAFSGAPPMSNALSTAIITDRSAIPADDLDRLRLLVGRYLD